MTFIYKVPTLSNKIGEKKLSFATIFQLQKTFVTKNNLVALNKLYKTLIANVDEVNNQQTTSLSVYYFCMSFVYYHQNQQLT